MKNLSEMDVISHYHPRIRNLCRTRWPSIMMEDKESEANYIMLCVIRTPSICKYNFWDEFTRTFIPYMDQRNKEENRWRYGCLSLDANLKDNVNGKYWTLYDCLSSSIPIEDALLTDEFLATLPKLDRDVLIDIVSNRTKASILRKYGLTRGKLARILQRLRDAYQDWSG